MILLDQIRETKLIELAKSRFDPDLSEAELKVLHDSASSEDPDMPAANAARPSIRPEFVRWLVSDLEAVPLIDPKGVRVYGATIPGKLDVRGCHVNPTLDFRYCEFQGEINLQSAETRGLFFFDSSMAKGIRAYNVIVHGPLFLLNIQSNGEILLLGARIEDALVCNGAKLKAKKYALFADYAKIDGGVFLRNGFESSGTIRLHSARIGVCLDFCDAKVAEVNCRNLQIGTDLIWLGIQKTKRTSLNLTGVKLKNLRDDLGSWPDLGNLILDGLVYEELTLQPRPTDEEIKNVNLSDELPLNVDERIVWLMLQPKRRRTEPQPWMQLRDLLERKGDRKGAKYVLFRFRCLQAQGSWILWRWLKIAFAWLEENPLRIGWSILFTLTLGTAVFAGAARSGAMIETVQIQPNMIATYAESSKGVARKPDEAIKPVSIHYTSFQPFIYTLENAVPLVKLGIDGRWMPDLQHQPRPWFPQVGWLYWLKWLNSYGFLVWFRWLLIVWGWVQATIFAASVADRFRK